MCDNNNTQQETIVIEKECDCGWFKTKVLFLLACIFFALYGIMILLGLVFLVNYANAPSKVVKKECKQTGYRPKVENKSIRIPVIGTVSQTAEEVEDEIAEPQGEVEGGEPVSDNNQSISEDKENVKAQCPADASMHLTSSSDIKKGCCYQAEFNEESAIFTVDSNGMYKVYESSKYSDVTLNSKADILMNNATNFLFTECPQEQEEAQKEEVSTEEPLQCPVDVPAKVFSGSDTQPGCCYDVEYNGENITIRNNGKNFDFYVDPSNNVAKVFNMSTNFTLMECPQEQEHK